MRKLHAKCVSASESGGEYFQFYTDVDRLEDHLKTLSPRDAGAIKDLCGLIRRLAKFPSYRVGKAPELMGLWDNVRTMARMVPYLKDFMNAGDLTLGALGARFTDPLLRGAIANFLPDETMPAMGLVLTLGPMSRRVAGYPLGGSLELARAIEQRCLSLGGRIVYRRFPAQTPLHPQDRAGAFRILSREHVDQSARRYLRSGKCRPRSRATLVSRGPEALRDLDAVSESARRP